MRFDRLVETRSLTAPTALLVPGDRLGGNMLTGGRHSLTVDRPPGATTCVDPVTSIQLERRPLHSQAYSCLLNGYH